MPTGISAKSFAPSAARSGSAFACSCAARRGVRTAGLPVLNACWCATRANAPSGVIFCCRTVEERLESGDYEAAYATASEAAAIGERCGDLDLVACARHQQGRTRLQQGQVEAGLAFLDETMVTVTAGELSPLVTGLMYCSVIGACQQVYAFDRAREWTAALTQWCEGQPDMVAFAGVCQVHRAEIMQLRGTWPEAIEEARRACLRSKGIDQRAAAAALYQAGRGLSSARGVLGGRAGVSRREPTGPGAAAGLGTVAPGPGTPRRGCHRHSTCRQAQRRIG